MAVMAEQFHQSVTLAGPSSRSSTNLPQATPSGQTGADGSSPSYADGGRRTADERGRKPYAQIDRRIHICDASKWYGLRLQSGIASALDV